MAVMGMRSLPKASNPSWLDQRSSELVRVPLAASIQAQRVVQAAPKVRKASNKRDVSMAVGKRRGRELAQVMQAS
jgi:hypothetical protein